VVKGDGSLLHSDFARTRPVETVLSGPAASLSGAAFVAGTKTALIADIGGTTTDVAFLQNGAPRLKPDGAFVGGWQTMVEAAEIRTCGLGGDSEVQPISRGRATGIMLGPRRAIPLSILAQSWPEVKQRLQAQLDLIVPMATDGRFVIPVMPDGVPSWLTRSEARLAQKALETGPSAVADLAATQLALGAVDRLISRGLLSLAAFTPTDATHVTGDFTDFDAEAAYLGAALMARQKNGFGDPIADDEMHIARMTLAELHRKSALALTDAAFAHDGTGEGIASGNALLSDIYAPQPAAPDNGEAQTSFLTDTQPKKLVSLSLQLDTSLIALGASASTHYPHIAKLMALDLTVPNHADVAGAVGAAAGSVRQRVMISVTQPSEGKFRVHLPDGPVDLGVMEDALTRARDAAHRLASDRAINAGASQIDVTLNEDVKLVTLSADKDLFIEALIYATAEGRAA
ncbi:MAG: hydantoinase/oxoprolinase family protein, partial [Candidatus Puniceispirillum sp.]